RLILQNDTELPPELIGQIRLLPFVEDAREIRTVEAPITPPVAATQSLRDQDPGDIIYLPQAKAITRGNPAITIAVLDTGVNLDHPELKSKIGKRFDFVDLRGIDTRNFVGEILGLDEVPEDELGHGTHVSGVVCATGLKMNEGVCPDCRLMAVRVLAT